MNNDEIDKKRERGELAFKDWLDENGLAYVYINQDPLYFAKLFKNTIKRPDFLVLIESVGILAVDVKNRSFYSDKNGKKFSIDMEEEVKGVNFERVFRMPFWYAYFDEENVEWYWISALKAFVIGKEKEDTDGKPFLAMDIDDFVKIDKNNDLGKIYSQRMEGL